jgi:hypothetical protein
LRVRDERRQRWQRAADEAGMPLAAWLKRVADLAAASEHGDPATAKADVIRIRREISALGNNVNQIARRMNERGDVPDHQISEALDELSELRGKLRRLLR